MDCAVGCLHLGVFLQGLRDRLHGQSRGGGRQLRAHPGSAGVDMRDAVTPFGNQPVERGRAVDSLVECLDLTGNGHVVGRHIAELEEQLGVTLFERTGRGLLPTAEASRLVESARAMAADADRLARKARGVQEWFAARCA